MPPRSSPLATADLSPPGSAEVCLGTPRRAHQQVVEMNTPVRLNLLRVIEDLKSLELETTVER